MKGLRFLNRPMTLMIQNTSEDLIQSLQEGRLDAVFVDSLYVGEALWSCKLFTESYYAVFPLHHRYRSRKKVKLAENFVKSHLSSSSPL
ncbi:hypothetical protein ACFQ5B_12260 [Laceyella putida]